MSARETVKKTLYAAFVRPYVRLAQAGLRVAQNIYTPVEGAVRGFWRWEKQLYLEKIAGVFLKTAEEAEKKGQALCSGKQAHLTFVPGMILRQAGRWGKRQYKTKTGKRIGIAGAVALAAAGLWNVAPLLTLATAVPALFLAAAGAVIAYPAIACAVTAAGVTGMMAAGAVFSLPLAVINIPAGFRNRRDALKNEATGKEDERRAARDARLAQLPALERNLDAYLEDLPGAAPRDRVELFEALKAKFPDDFARAAALTPEDLSPVLQSDVRLSKPLKFKTASPAAAPDPQKRGLLRFFRGNAAPR